VLIDPMLAPQETRDYGSIQQMYETAVRKCETAIALWRAASLNGDDERIKRCIEWASGLKNQVTLVTTCHNYPAVQP